jgi:hypothetical protein
MMMSNDSSTSMLITSVVDKNIDTEINDKPLANEKYEDSSPPLTDDNKIESIIMNKEESKNNDNMTDEVEGLIASHEKESTIKKDSDLKKNVDNMQLYFDTKNETDDIVITSSLKNNEDNYYNDDKSIITENHLAVKYDDNQNDNNSDIILSSLVISEKNLDYQSSTWPPAPHDDFTIINHLDVSWPDLVPNTGEFDDHVLKWVVDQQHILMRVVTWNMQANDPPPLEEVQRILMPPNRFVE